MDVSTIGKNYARLQKQSINNFFDVLTLFEDQIERTNRYWAYQMGVDNHVQAASCRFKEVLKQRHYDTKELLEKSWTHVETYFSQADSKHPLD